MSWLGNMRKQTAVYWGSPTPNGRGGWSFDDPVELAPGTDTGVRWQDSNELFIDANGAEQTAKSIVFPSQALALDGYLFLGTLADLSSADEGDPQIVEGAQRIQRVDRTINTRNNRTIWKAYL